ncbi:hypothetical protein EWM64_g5233 [Hericium alpestre]|uniref:Uncharacterized protein n=1 Tax=Hericium alpestre TaxID=135208 RepID=A0A4Y9ZVF9_9AGAM|nr:hypothetical protein EWM64_g5233 [Hericium alpestre]
MATLTRSPIQATPYDDQLSVLASTVPTPFPSLEETARPAEDRHVEQPSADAEVEEKDPFADNVAAVDEDQVEVAAESQDVLPSITYVQKSCLITLNDLLSVSSPWRSIVPDRRHSLPTDTIRSTPLDTPDPQPALQELLINLRARTPSSEMQQVRPLPSDEVEMLHELRARVDIISALLEPEDSELARTLVALLSQLHRLSVLGISSSSTLALPHLHSALPASPQRHDHADVFNALSRQLSDFQVQQHHARSRSESAGVPPVQAVEQALLWSSIDTNLETVLRLCRERAEAFPPPRVSQDQLPPDYDPADYEFEGPPKYEYDFGTAPSESKMPAQGSMSNTSPHISEKMRLDLDAVTMAIDRLYDVAPQLLNQRVELKSKKRAELERARLRGEDGEAKLKEKERDLDRIVDMIGRASERRLGNQTVMLEGGMKAQLEKARHRDLQKRQAFVSKLIEHSDAGRMHSQDASFQASKLKDPDALLSLPEFMRESVPSALLPQPDPRTLLTLPDDASSGPSDYVGQVSFAEHVRAGLRLATFCELIGPGFAFGEVESTEFSPDFIKWSTLDANWCVTVLPPISLGH